jgi:hypothetical protein
MILLNIFRESGARNEDAGAATKENDAGRVFSKESPAAPPFKKVPFFVAH